MEPEEHSEYSAAHLERCAKAGQAWGGGGGPAKTVVNWWKEKLYSLGHPGAVQARIDSDWQRLQCGPGRDKAIWEPRHGAFVAQVNLIADSDRPERPCPKYYYQISRILLQAAGRWSESYVIAHSAFVGCKVALCETDGTHNRYYQDRAPDGQPIPGSARFSPIPGTTLDLVISLNDYWGFSVPEPYLNARHDLVAMIG